MQRRNVFVSYLAGVLVAASIVSSPAVAQSSPIGKGSWIIGGSAGINSQHVSGNDQSVTSVSLAPSALYFVSPGLALGGSVILGYSDNPQVSSKSFGVGPSVRYYFGDKAAKTLPFLSATVEPVWQSNDPKSSTGQSTSSTNLLIEGTVGLTHLVASHVGITGEAYYDHLEFSSDRGDIHVDQSSYAFGLRFGITAFVF
jgi:hypothetical protein